MMRETSISATGVNDPCAVASNKGFTLIELLIAMLVGSMVMAAVMVSFQSQHKVYLAQDEVVEMQQNVRVAMDMITREIRMAGFDPTGNAGAGFETATATQLTLTQDLDGDGSVIATPPNADERVSYRLNASPVALGRVTGNGVVYQPVADNIVAIEFYYLDASGNPTAVLDAIRAVQISILARAAVEDQSYSNTHKYTSASGVDLYDGTLPNVADGFRRQLLIQTVQCRNMGL